MGRLPESGQVFYLGRVRWQGWRHSEMLHQFLGRFSVAGQYEKLEMLEQLLKGGGFDPDCPLPSNEPGENEETTQFLDSFLM